LHITGELLGEHIIPTLSPGQFLGLALVTAIIAGALSLEHYALGRRCWPRRHYYAIGLLTDAGLLLAWAGIEQVQLNLGTAALLLFAGCLAGVPDYLLLQRRDKRLMQAWREMVDRNGRLAARLAKLMLLGNHRVRNQVTDLVESLGFVLGSMRKDLEDMQILVRNLEPLLSEILAVCQDGEEDKDT